MGSLAIVCYAILNFHILGWVAHANFKPYVVSLACTCLVFLGPLEVCMNVEMQNVKRETMNWKNFDVNFNFIKSLCCLYLFLCLIGICYSIH